MTKDGAHNHGEDISRSVRSSMSWNMLEYAFSQIVTVLVFVFLTYKLEPAVFGIFALTVIVIDYFCLQGKSAGIDALVRRQNFGKLQLNSAFGTLVGTYSIGLIFCFIAGMMIATFSGEDIVRLMLPALCLTLIPCVIEIVPGAILSKARDFKGSAIRQVLGTSLGAIIAVVFAFSDYPEWTLVAQRLTQTTACAIFMCLRAKWFPTFSFDFEMARSFFKDWARVFLAQAIAVSIGRSVDLIVGLGIGTTELGVMRIATKLTSALYAVLGAPIGRLWVILVSEADQPALRATLYRDLTRLASLLFIPAFFGLFMMSSELVDLVLGDSYKSAASVLRVLSIAGFIAPLYYFRIAAFTAVGLLNKLVVFSCMDVIVASAFCLIFIHLGFGLPGAVASFVGVAIFQSFMITPILLREMHTKANVLAQALFPAYVAGTIMAIGLFVLKSAFGSEPTWVHTILLVLSGAVIFFGCLLCLFRRWLIDTIAIAVPSIKDHQFVAKLIG